MSDTTTAIITAILLFGLFLLFGVASWAYLESTAPARGLVVAASVGAALAACYGTAFNPLVAVPVLAAGYVLLGRMIWIAHPAAERFNTDRV